MDDGFIMLSELMDFIKSYNESQDILTQFETSSRSEADGFFQLLEESTGRYKQLKEKLPYHINVIDELHVNEVGLILFVEMKGYL